MRVACLGGGPAGLTFAIAMKLRDPAHDIVVVERNRPYDTFGWGVVLSDETLANLKAADPESAEAIRRAFAYWDDIAVFYRGSATRSSGHGFCGIGRKRLLNILQDRAQALGVGSSSRRRSTASSPTAGTTWSLPPTVPTPRCAAPSPMSSSRTSMCAPASTSGSARTRSSTTPSPSSSRRPTRAGSGRTPTSSMPTPPTFIVECSEATWRRFGFDRMSQEETHGGLREHLCREPRRPSADDQRPTPARLGLAQLQPCAVRALVA